MSVTLGNIEFQVDELPESINLGGEQTLAVIKYPGGGIDVQPLGSFDDPISWDGVLWFAQAVQRCEALDNMRIQGTEVQLNFGSFSRNVVIHKFTYKYYNDFYIEYSIELQPLDYFNGLSASTVSSGSEESQGTGSYQSSSSQSTPSQVSYTVKSGDTLWAIAVNFYGDGTKFTQIASNNNIKNPSSINVGQVITINNPTRGI